jgi:hypothetical protein
MYPQQCHQHVRVPSRRLTKDILENYFADVLFVICLNLFDNFTKSSIYPRSRK